MNDGEKIGCEFGFWAMNRVAENHDFSTVLLCHKFKDFKAESAQSIPTGNNKRELISSHKSDQYGLQSFAFEVESATDVKDNLRLRVERLHVGDLSVEVVSLFVAANSAVTNKVCGFWFSLVDEAVNIKQSLTCCVSD